MKHIGLFEGIGGFSLAARWMEWETVAWCEWNDFGQRVLRHHFPEAIGHGDITKTDFTPYANKIDILTGGFPCQPYSAAGKRRGKEDDRHLWPQMLRSIREIAPRYVVGENVLGLVNWNGGMVFDEVCADLELEGYEVTPVVIPAAAVNAPHGRDRVWFVAYSKNNHNRKQGGKADTSWENVGGRQSEVRTEFARHGDSGPTPDTDSDGQHQRHGRDEVNASQGWVNALGDVEQVAMHTDSSSKSRQYIGNARQRKSNRPNSGDGRIDFTNFPTQSPICSGDDGLPRQLDGITFPKWRAESIKAYGNAIVPQVAYQLFKAIQQFETT